MSNILLLNLGLGTCYQLQNNMVKKWVSLVSRLSLFNLTISVQAEIFLLPDPTFLEGFYLNFHMPGHFFLYEFVYAYPSGPLARLHKNRTKRL